MYKELPKLVMFREIGQDSVIIKLSDIIREFDTGNYDKTDLVGRIYEQIHELLKIATDYGFDRNLWQDYITFVIVTNENPFSLTCERQGINCGSVNGFAVRDMMVFNRLFNYDFSKLEKELEIDCFSIITDYKSIQKRLQIYNRSVSERVRELSERIRCNLEDKTDETEAASNTLKLVTDFYRDYGVGMIGLNKAFRIDDDVNFIPISNSDDIHLSDLIGYEIQKNKLKDNTEAFLAGCPANNVLLFGDAGTGKSTSVKALISEYYKDGLRMIELYKHQMKHLSAVISRVKSRNYKFIIYMDDLSFEEEETEYKYLKAVIEGGLETRPDNVLIYATSNRRNLIRETWNDINDIQLDKHHSDTVQEKLSLVSRFGMTIGYIRPDKKLFDEIVKGIAQRYPEIGLSEEELIKEATKWEISHGGMSGRVAKQYIDYIVAIHSS
ncbi:MAG: ATP-binding protein [Eubacterium sp.]|nr:ATP-binding protein [Eubacterium sp.]